MSRNGPTEGALRQNVIDLHSNATKYTPAGGEVAVFARLSAGGEIILGVRDTGYRD